jgi:hypothetical protein
MRRRWEWTLDGEVLEGREWKLRFVFEGSEEEALRC